jgi:hypothetical protein
MGAFEQRLRFLVPLAVVLAGCQVQPRKPKHITIESLYAAARARGDVQTQSSLETPALIDGTVAVISFLHSDEALIQLYLPDPQKFSFANHVQGAAGVERGDRITLRCERVVLVDASPFLAECQRAVD